jgi:hypothetical protein
VKAVPAEAQPQQGREKSGPHPGEDGHPSGPAQGLDEAAGQGPQRRAEGDHEQEDEHDGKGVQDAQLVLAPEQAEG